MRDRFVTTLSGRPVGWLETLDDDWWRGQDIIGTPGDDTLRGTDGADLIDGGAGADLMAGRLGDDTYMVDNLGDVVKENRDAGVDSVIASVDWTLSKHVENLTLASGIANLNGTGNKADNLIKDNRGSNWLDGAQGNDTLIGGSIWSPSYSDTLVGGKGDDLLQAGQLYYSHDLLDGGDGNDTLLAVAGDDTLYGGDGNDLLDGGLAGYHGGVGELHGGQGQDTLSGGRWMYGEGGSDLLQVRVNAVYVSGADGSDTITGGGGDPSYSTTFAVDAGFGNDSVNVSSVNTNVDVDGGGGDDQLIASGMVNVTIEGGLGDDVVRGEKWGAGTMTLDGGKGNDTVTGGGGHGYSELHGGDGNDRLSWGSAGESTSAHLAGDAGNDTLQGGSGLVSLEGGDGNDLFVLCAREVLGTDMTFIRDFASGTDQLGISQAALKVGNGDQVVDGAVMVDGPGGFAPGAELVIVTADVAGSLTLDKAAAAIGSADHAYKAGQTVVFMVDNGTDTWALYFESSGKDATVSASELSVLAYMLNTPSTTIDDVSWTAA